MPDGDDVLTRVGGEIGPKEGFLRRAGAATADLGADGIEGHDVPIVGEVVAVVTLAGGAGRCPEVQVVGTCPGRHVVVVARNRMYPALEDAPRPVHAAFVLVCAAALVGVVASREDDVAGPRDDQSRGGLRVRNRSRDADIAGTDQDRTAGSGRDGRANGVGPDRGHGSSRQRPKGP